MVKQAYRGDITFQKSQPQPRRAATPERGTVTSNHLNAVIISSDSICSIAVCVVSPWEAMTRYLSTLTLGSGIAKRAIFRVRCAPHSSHCCPQHHHPLHMPPRSPFNSRERLILRGGLSKYRRCPPAKVRLFAAPLPRHPHLRPKHPGQTSRESLSSPRRCRRHPQ